MSADERTCLDLVDAPDAGGTAAGSVTVYPDGPLLVRGEVAVVTPDGTPVPNARRTVALCRCGTSAIKPWCDGTHKIARFSAP